MNAHEQAHAASERAALEAALSAHDQELSAAGLVVWVGTEPTFTDRFSYEPEWVAKALGAAKLEKARRFTAAFAAQVPGAVLLRTLGRQYPEEPEPRWCFGLYWSREPEVAWRLPPDPLMGGRPSGADAPERLLAELQRELTSLGVDFRTVTNPGSNTEQLAAAAENARGAAAHAEAAPPEHAALELQQASDAGAQASACGDQVGGIRHRLVYPCPSTAPAAQAAASGTAGASSAPPASALAELEQDSELFAECFRAPLGGAPSPASGLSDRLTQRGLQLLAIGELAVPASRDEPVVRVELPRFESTAAFAFLLGMLERSCRAANIKGLILTGYPPPIDQTVASTTITPDPGVIEINTAPCLGTRGLLHDSRILYRVAAALGLSPERMHYNGELVDSGGGGQITLGGPSFEASPFFVNPHLLPRLVAYVSAHPALSYLFAVDSVGGSSQSPRADEGSIETHAELALALELLERCPAPSPEQIWSSLAPFLVDRFGNAHRAELNIEKLANPHLPDRGRLGLVEFRAFRMADSPERAASLAALLRAVVAMLARRSARPVLAEWGRELHDRFSLPFNLEGDLRAILSDLEQSGWGLGEPIVKELMRDHRLLSEVDLSAGAAAQAGQSPPGEAWLELRQAVEFWPLVGDLSEQSGTSRLVDSSTRRYELRLRCPEAAAESWKLGVDGCAVPWVSTADPEGHVLVRGIRCRSFVPTPGLHPELPAHGPLAVRLINAAERRALCVTLHWWHPSGGAYPGLPVDHADADARRQARCVLEPMDYDAVSAPLREPPPGSLTTWNFDTRWV